MQDLIDATREQITRDRQMEEVLEMFFHGPPIASAHGILADWPEEEK